MSVEKLTRHGLYPGPHGRYYRWTGEKRGPRKGEFYLSGSVIHAYESLGDMDYPYHIAALAQERPCPTCGHRKAVKQ